MFIAIYAVFFSLVTEAVLGVTLEQKDLFMTKGEDKTVYISCKVTGLSSDYVHWYQKKDGEALTRILYIKRGSSLVQDPNHPEAKDFSVRIQSDNYELKIASLKKSHSAVYYCASWDYSSDAHEVIFLLLNITLWDYVKVFGSGTRLNVTDIKVKAPQYSVYPVFKSEKYEKSVLLCQARGMFPDLVRFTWQAKDLNGQKVELGDDEILEQTDKDLEVRITSMLIVDKQKAITNYFTCSVQHDSDKHETLSIPRDPGFSKTSSIQKPEEEDEEEEIRNFGSFELSRKLYLFSLTYVILLVKNVFYFCIVSVLLSMRNPAHMEMIQGKLFTKSPFFVTEQNTVSSRKLFGSGTKLYVTDTNTLKDQVKTPQVAVYQVSKLLQNKKRVLLCQAKDMFPDLVRFTWQAEDQSGKKVELKDYEQLEQRDDNPEIRITSMLIVDKDKLRTSTFTCSVQHDSSVEDQSVIVPRGLFELSRSLYLFSLTYVILLVKNILYFCTVSVLLCKTNAAIPS
ncbi:hypothetical protein Q7C36_004915 [Tachysurus vachellii]|uniref:Ig-like domain-containing protein n=1 Tax=Tachysurus vachellii TaxID=175792 RepID=A0AA88TBN4_TACVA|nr:hypothetical protein Q7C36_004915 [Tachysurus vachellii]